MLMNRRGSSLKLNFRVGLFLIVISAFFLEVAIFVVAMWCQAHADEAKPAPPARTIDMTAVLHDERGGPLKDPYTVAKDDPACAKCVDMTVGVAISHALLASLDEDRSLPWEQKWAFGLLAERVRANPAATLTAAETVKIEDRIGKVFSPIVIVQIVQMLEPGRKPPEVQ